MDYFVPYASIFAARSSPSSNKLSTTSTPASSFSHIPRIRIRKMEIFAIFFLAIASIAQSQAGSAGREIVIAPDRQFQFLNGRIIGGSGNTGNGRTTLRAGSNRGSGRTVATADVAPSVGRSTRTPAAITKTRIPLARTTRKAAAGRGSSFLDGDGGRDDIDILPSGSEPSSLPTPISNSKQSSSPSGPLSSPAVTAPDRSASADRSSITAAPETPEGTTFLTVVRTVTANATSTVRTQSTAMPQGGRSGQSENGGNGAGRTGIVIGDGQRDTAPGGDAELPGGDGTADGVAKALLAWLMRLMSSSLAKADGA